MEQIKMMEGNKLKTKRRRIALAVCALVLCGAAIGTAAPAPEPPAVTEPAADEPVAPRTDYADVALLGNSQIDSFRIYDTLPGADYLYRVGCLDFSL